MIKAPSTRARERVDGAYQLYAIELASQGTLFFQTTEQAVTATMLATIWQRLEEATTSRSAFNFLQPPQSGLMAHRSCARSFCDAAMFKRQLYPS